MPQTSRSARARTLVLTGVAGLAVLTTLGVAPVTASARATSVAATYSCSAAVLGTTYTFTSQETVQGSTPSSVTPGASVSMTGYQMTSTIPVSVVNEIYGVGVRSISGKVTTEDVTATDAKPGTVNAAGKGITIPSISLVQNQPLTLTLPATPATVGKWAATKAGTMSFRTGTLVITVTTSLGSGTAKCTPKPALTFATTKVA